VISFDSVTAAIRTALPSEQGSVGDARASADPATVREPLNRLKKLLKNDDGDASDFIIDARPALSRVLTESEINTLTGLVGDFDFEAALRSLANISARLSLKLE
jgi:hypothetical protein